MLVVLDRYIPFVAEALAPIAHVEALAPEAITPDAVREADALFIRTRTHANSELLEGSKVQFVATATIGYDHIDTDYCAKAGIRWISCPGCNAQAVCDYIATVLDNLSPLNVHRSPVIGIIGYGHIGSLVARMAEQKGMKVLVNDPPKHIGVPLDVIARQCDIITFHTPLTYAPTPFPTYHLCDADFLARCKPETFIINAARGGIADEMALLRSGHPCAIDCWENEPDINRELLLSPNTRFASFHIAGYSLQGKRNASEMCLAAFCEHFHLPPLAIPAQALTLLPEQTGDSAEGWLQRITASLKAQPDSFESLRKSYRLR